jgi:hypothetical protein
MAPASRRVDDVSAPYTNIMVNPAPAGPGVCATCWTFIDAAYPRCFKCGREVPRFADKVVPITYSVYGQMHHALRSYKDGPTKKTRDTFTMDLAAILWRFLRDHEPCLASSVGSSGFSVVTVVPSATAVRDHARGRLRQIVGQVVGPTRDRYARLLTPTDSSTPPHKYDPERFSALQQLHGDDVLLVDDTWTTGASVQSAARTLKLAGAGRIGVVVIGRQISLDYQDHADRLKVLPRPFRWDTCAAHKSRV